ncbi:MAG: SGNH/GDSL hydrolase family protein [Candidatus Polarisedimenticolia bacterium]
MPLTGWKRGAFVALMVAGILGFAEAAAAVAWFATVPRGERDALERLMKAGGRGPGGASSVLRFASHPYFLFVNNPEFTTPDGRRLHDPIGVRATGTPLRDKPDGVLRVVALGASTTYGYYYDDPGGTWPARLRPALETALGRPVEVINFGVPGHTTYETLGMAAMWLPELRPDVVLLTVGVNDAFAVGYPDEGGPDNTLFRHAWEFRPPSPVTLRLMRWSHLLRLAGRAWLSRAAGSLDFIQALQRPLPPAGAVEANARNATGKYFRRNLETLVLLTRHAGARPVLLTNPHNPARESAMGSYYDAVLAAIRRNNGIIAEVGRSGQVAVVDLYPRLRDPGLFRDAVHPNDRGMAAITTALVEALPPALGGGRHPAPAANRPGDYALKR